MFFEKKIDKHVLSIGCDPKGKHFEVRITNDGNIVVPPLEFRGRFWRKPKAFASVISELSELGVTINKQALSMEIERAFITNFDKEQPQDMVSELSELKHIHGLLEDDARHIIDRFDVVFTPSLGLKARSMFTMFTIMEAENNELKQTPCLIFDNKKVVPLIPEAMSEEQIYPIFIPTTTSNRWDIHAIRAFMKGNTPKPSENLTLCDNISEIYKKYIEFHEGPTVYKFMALWTIGTYLQPLFKAYPYVYLHGIKASGKTKTLDVTQQLAFNAISSANMSTSSLFRMIQSMSATVLIDEGEGLKEKERKEAFREILLSGYKKGTKTFRVEETRTDGNKSYIVKEFALFSPKIIANISGLEDVLESRCILIHMKPAANQLIANLEIDEEHESWQEMRNRLYLFLMTSWQFVEKIYQTTENDGFYKNREWELWKPILALSKFFGCFDEIDALAKRLVLSFRKEEIESNESLVLQILIDMIDEDCWVSLKEIMDITAENMGFIWYEEVQTKDGYRTDRKGRIPQWLNSRYIGNILRRLGFNERRRVGKGYEVFLKKADITDQAIRMNLVEHIKESTNKEEWILAQLSDTEPKPIACLEQAYRDEFGDTDENIGAFWHIYKKLREKGIILEPKPDICIKTISTSPNSSS